MKNRTLSKQTDDVIVERVLPDIHRVRTHGRVIGYVHETGPVYVSLDGSIYNIAVEVGQTHDLDSAVRLLTSR